MNADRLIADINHRAIYATAHIPDPAAREEAMRLYRLGALESALRFELDDGDDYELPSDAELDKQRTERLYEATR